MATLEKETWIIKKSKGIMNTNRIPQSKKLEEYYNTLESSQAFALNDENSVFVSKAVKASAATLSCCSDEEHKDDERLKIAEKIFDLLKNKVKCDDSSINDICGNASTLFDCIKNKNNSYAKRERYLNSLKGSAEKLYKKLKKKTNVYTHSFISDYNRIVFSSSFRRLQDKAQVFSLEEHDYARTRLTHSIEVSSIAAQLANLCALKIFRNDEREKKNMSFQMEKVLSCAALLHDIGNPPYGHYGEDVIKKFFEDHWDKFKYFRCHGATSGNHVSIGDISDTAFAEWARSDFTKFDGNAQSLRIASKLQLYKPGHSLDLTAAVLGAIIKYPLRSVDSDEDKFGYFYSEKEVIHDLTSLDVFKDGIRNPLVFLLEAADDISYVTSDFDDIVKKQVITYENFVCELEKIDTDDKELIKFKKDFEQYYDENKKMSAEAPFELTILRMTNDLRIKLIEEVVDAFCDDTNYAKIKKGINIKSKEDLFDNIGKKTKELLDLVPSAELIRWIKKNIFKKYVYGSMGIVENELTGDEILTYLLETFCETMLRLNFNRNEKGEFYLLPSDKKKEFLKYSKIFSLISNNFIEQFKADTEKIEVNSLEHIYYRFRLVVDYVSGMTDNYAKEVYQVLRGIK